MTQKTSIRRSDDIQRMMRVYILKTLPKETKLTVREGYASSKRKDITTKTNLIAMHIASSELRIGKVQFVEYSVFRRDMRSRISPITNYCP